MGLFRRGSEEFTFAPAWGVFAAATVTAPPFLSPRVRGRSVLRVVGVGLLAAFLLWALGVALFTRDEFLYELSKVQFPWEDASKRTVLVNHFKTQVYRAPSGGALVPESLSKVPAGYVSTVQEAWVGVDEEGRYTQYVSRSENQTANTSSQSYLTRDGEFLKELRTIRGREERSTRDNLLAVDPELIRSWPEVYLAEPGWEDEGTVDLDGVEVWTLVRSMEVDPENPRTAGYERLVLEVGTGRLLRHYFLTENGSLSTAVIFIVDELFEDPDEVPPEVWEPTF